MRFNLLRATFLLVASVIGAQAIIALSIVVTCEYGVLSGRLPIGACKDVQTPVVELLNTALASAIAFIALHMKE